MVVVTTPQEVALLDSRKAVRFADSLNLDVLGVIENMSGYTCAVEPSTVTGNLCPRPTSRSSVPAAEPITSRPMRRVAGPLNWMCSRSVGAR